MICPHCNNEYSDQDRFCAHCGMQLTSTPEEKKGRHWVPILIMVLIFTFGTGLFFLLPGTPPENESPESQAWFYVDNGVLSFSQDTYTGGSELRIPDSVDGMTVIALSDGCFENCTNLESVILPATLQAIGEDAFRGCTSLRGIEIPDTVLLIGAGAFSGCTSLEAVCVYEGIQSIGAGAFGGCTKLFYIYYSGHFEDWNKRYSEFINPYTTVFSQDGTFYQGEAAN